MALRRHLESGFLRRRPLFWLALAFCAGIVLDASFEPSWSALTATSVAAIFITWLSAFLFRHLSAIAAIFTALALGAFVHAANYRIPTSTDVIRRTPERPCFAFIRGTIIEAEWRSSHDARNPFQRIAWTVALESLGDTAANMSLASGRIRVAVKAPHSTLSDSENALALTLAEGDRIEFQALIEPLPISTLPDSFDYGTYLASLGINRVGTVSSATLRKINGPAWWHLALILRRFSGTLAARTVELLNGHTEQAGLLNAMAFGRRESLSVSDREAFAISGTAHLLAISGLHIQLLCVMLWRLLNLFRVSRRKSALYVLASCFAYCLLTGSSPPAVRATVMFGAYVAASFFDREADPLSALALAALVILCYAPHNLFSVGFQLSFLAVLSLHTLLPIFEDTWESWHEAHTRPLALAPGEPLPFSERAKQKIVESLLLTLAAWLATSPSVAWHMNRVSTLGLFVNLLALPLLSVCMAIGTATIVIGYFWLALGKVLGFVAWIALATLESINSFCASLPGAAIDVRHPAVIALILYAGLLAWLWISPPPRVYILRVCATVIACPLLLLTSLLISAAPASPEVTFLDLLNGHATLIETNSGATLIDSGGKGQGLRIAELLRRRSIHRLNLLVVTADQPGAIDGAIEVVSRVLPQQVRLPRCKFPSESRRALETFLTEKNVPYSSPAFAEDIATPDGLHWEFYDDGPPAGKPAANGSTLCVRLTSPNFSTLFVDAKSTASLGRLLSKNPAHLSADVLRILPGEYGRWPREMNELLRRTQSKIIVAGSASVPDDFSQNDSNAGAQVFSPRRDGSIRVRKDANGIFDLQGYRGEWNSIADE